MSITLEHPRYRFDRWIASGGMGEVWAATDTLLDRGVAVKLLRRDLAADPILRARFESEARHTASLQHPHVASVLDYGELPDEGPDGAPAPFLVMELIGGRPLSELIAPGRPMPPERAADLVAQAAEGVGAAHRLGIVHRDVKPGNLLVTEGGQVKVTDFGVARAADAAPLTLTGHLVGTPYYLAPEQAEGAPATPASDVYSLGIVLYECLTGQKPFANESPVVTALMQIRDPLPPLPASVPAWLRTVVTTATAKDPDARYATAGALGAALRRSASVTEPGTTTVEPAPAEPAAADEPTRVVETIETRPRRTSSHAAPRRRGALVLVAVFAVVVLLLALSWLVLGRSSEPTPRATTPSPSPTQPAPAQVRVQPSTYVGMPHHEAADRLRAMGLAVDTVARPNPGDEAPHTVASVSPSGLLSKDTLITLEVWSAPAPPAKSANQGNGGHAHAKQKPTGGKAGAGHGHGQHGGGKQGRGSGHKGGSK